MAAAPAFRDSFTHWRLLGPVADLPFPRWLKGWADVSFVTWILLLIRAAIVVVRRMRSGGLRIKRKTDVRPTFLQFRYKVRTELLRVENWRTIWTGGVVSIVTATLTLLLSK